MFMRIFTKLFAVLMLLGVSVVANAEKKYATLNSLSSIGSANATWDAGTNTISWTSGSYNCVSNFDLPTGDISSWEKVVVNVTSLDNADGIRIQIHFSDGTEPAKDFKGTGVKSMNLSDFGTEEQLQNVSWIRMLGAGNYSGDSHTFSAETPGKAVIAEVYLERPDDPLALPKENLQKSINLATALNASVSGAPLAEMIAAATAAKASSTTEEELTTAKSNLDYAIGEKGFAPMTKDIFMTYANQGDAEGTVNAECSYKINENTDLPYGLSTVDWKNYADLSSYEYLIVTASAGAPRFCFNRIEDGGQDNDDPAQSKMIDIPNKGWGTNAYRTVIDNNIHVINLKKMVEDKGFAYLHCIKDVSWQKVTVTAMYLYKTPAVIDVEVDGDIDLPEISVPEVEEVNPEIMPNKLALMGAINDIYNTNLSGLTEGSLLHINKLVADGEALLKEATPAVEGLVAAKENIEAALADATTVQPGTYDLTQEMFLTWSGIGITAKKGASANGALQLGAASAGNTIYGNPSVVWTTYADIADFDKLVIVGTPGVQLRVLFNRLEVGNGGGDGNGGALTEKNPVIGENGTAVIDLKELGGVARLNAIKLGWGSPAGEINSMFLVKGNVDYTVGVNAVKTATDNAVIFNLKGQRLSQPAKGVNIINGKKIVVK